MLRRRVVSVGLTSLPFWGVLGTSQSTYARSGGQRDWRYCSKCQSMFFDGYPDKGKCPAGGGHQAAGFNFVLPYDVTETTKAQRQWRYCGKCHGLFYDGYPQKGVCPAGGGHQAIGFNFVLSHDVAGSNKAQDSWRYCQKCASMFFDGFATKGSCAAGGAHQSAGFIFVLPHEGDSFANMLETFWREAGRGIVSEQIKQTVNGMNFSEGVSAYNCVVNLGNIVPTWRRTGPSALRIDMPIPGSNVELKTTTPTIFGSYADPSFRVGFDILLQLAARAQVGAPYLAIDHATLDVTRASVHGSNATGTVVETVADFFSRGRFSRSITNRINSSQDIKGRLQNAINGALSRVPNLRAP